MIDSRAKGARIESEAKKLLIEHTGLNWQRVPGSGALDPKHKLKGDLYIPELNNVYCVEVKGYAEDHLNSSLLTGKTPQLLEFWLQAVRQGKQVGKKPLLIFKFDRSKFFVCFEAMPTTDHYRWIFAQVDNNEFYISQLKDWLHYESPKFLV